MKLSCIALIAAAAHASKFTIEQQHNIIAYDYASRVTPVGTIACCVLANYEGVMSLLMIQVMLVHYVRCPTRACGEVDVSCI
jgi:hypothetical protein